MSKWVLNVEGLTTQGCRLLTFIHCSSWRTASRYGATVAGSTSSSANNSIPPRLLVAASVIGAERIGSASWISGNQTTTSRAGSGCASSPSPKSLQQPLRRSPPPAWGLLRQLPRSPVPRHQRVPLPGYHFLRLQHLSSKVQVYQSHLVATTTLRDHLYLREYSPSTTLASGNAASAAGASDSA
jgi:hypothetical protein